MGTPEIPQYTEECAGCQEGLNLLVPYLHVQLKPKQNALLLTESQGEGGLLEQSVTLGTRSGRGVMLKFHDFDCVGKWVAKRKGRKPLLEPHVEDEIYVPEDNRSPEELVKDKEPGWTKERLTAMNALTADAERSEG